MTFGVRFSLLKSCSRWLPKIATRMPASFHSCRLFKIATLPLWLCANAAINAHERNGDNWSKRTAQLLISRLELGRWRSGRPTFRGCRKCSVVSKKGDLCDDTIVTS